MDPLAPPRTAGTPPIRRHHPSGVTTPPAPPPLRRRHPTGAAAGGLAAALSTASGLLLVISSSVANDVCYKRVNPAATEAKQLLVARAFGLGAASFFPILVLGIFWKKCTAAGTTAGMVAGLATTLACQAWTFDIYGNSDGLFGISETSVGAVGMVINFAVTIAVSQFTTQPTQTMQQLVEDIRYPGRSELVAAHAGGALDDEHLHGEHGDDDPDGTRSNA